MSLMSGLASAVLFGAVLAMPATAENAAAKIVNDPSAGWGKMGTAASIAIVKDAEVQGGSAVRFTVLRKGMNPWESSAHVFITKPLVQGDVLLLAFWAKAVEPPQGSTAIVVTGQFQRTDPPFFGFGYARLNVGPQWKVYYVQAVADKDYKAKEMGVELDFEADSAVIDLGPLFVLDFGKDYDRTKLPKS
jgi:hypothetical protein